MTLTKGANTVKFTASQLYNYDGTTIGLVHSGGGTDVRHRQHPGHQEEPDLAARRKGLTHSGSR
ncbi:hypothetical protein [Streptomyces canus]|uniref:Uncharacterized protein n=1 Tax=Streptomyces canus TaxID=58343 RepID=A0AAW8FT30_9ACTN|nr:hypothetical protein [Streptomyces canus]MDQ0912555.1 hypothetical protein [Streptomyces canus]MDQ1072540.1 hypothetical protein [Streptomyces canus]